MSPRRPNLDMKSTQMIGRRPPRREWSLFLAVVLVLSGVWFAPEAHAQQRNNSAANTSDLALQNLSRVAATAAEIKAVLLNDAGLMVELKRWVARDATEHGQIISDLDLASEGIFERLESDLPFRSVATALVRRYGYLLPKVTPDSEVGMERAKERTKWLAQNQTASCDPQIDKECNVSQTRPSSAGGPGQEFQQRVPPSRTFPGERTLPNLPSSGENPTTRERLMQTDEDSTVPSFSQLPLSGFYDSGSSPNTLNVKSTESVGPQMGRANPGRTPSSASADGNSTLEGASDGLLAAYGSGMNSANTLSSDAGGINGRETSPAAYAGASSMVSIQPSIRRPESNVLSQPPEMIRKPSPYQDIPSLYDMYMQAVPRPATPRRFGAEVFNNGTRDSQLIPMDLPVGPDYVVGSGDGLSIDLWGSVSQRLYRTVDREGRVSLPEVGPVLVSGKSLDAVQQYLQQTLRTQFRDVSADVSLARLRTIRVYEVGDVANPGAYDISSLSTPLNALFVAGGPGRLRRLDHRAAR